MSEKDKTKTLKKNLAKTLEMDLNFSCDTPEKRERKGVTRLDPSAPSTVVTPVRKNAKGKHGMAKKQKTDLPADPTEDQLLAWEQSEPSEEDKEQTLRAFAVANKNKKQRADDAALGPVMVSFSQETKEDQEQKGQKQHKLGDALNTETSKVDSTSLEEDGWSRNSWEQLSESEDELTDEADSDNNDNKERETEDKAAQAKAFKVAKQDCDDFWAACQKPDQAVTLLMNSSKPRAFIRPSDTVGKYTIVYLPTFSDKEGKHIAFMQGDPRVTTPAYTHHAAGSKVFTMCCKAYNRPHQFTRYADYNKGVKADRKWTKLKTVPIMAIPTDWAFEWLDKEITGAEIANKIKACDVQKTGAFQMIIDWLELATVVRTGAVSMLGGGWTTVHMSKPKVDHIKNNIMKRWPALGQHLLPPTPPPPSVTTVDHAAIMKQMTDFSKMLIDLVQGTQKGKKRKRKQDSDDKGSSDDEDYQLFQGSKTRLAHMLGWCGLSINDTDEIPEIHFLMHKKKDSEKRQLLQVAWQKAAQKRNPLCNPILTNQLWKDIKEFNFGKGGDISFQSSNQGITPLSTPNFTYEGAQKMRQHEDIIATASFTSVSEAHKQTNNPRSIPHDGLVYIAQLDNYLSLLQEIFGEKCAHYINVLAARTTLWKKLLANMGNPDLVPTRIHGMWTIHEDARQHFNTFLTVEDLQNDVTITSDLALLLMTLRSNGKVYHHGTPDFFLKGLTQQQLISPPSKEEMRERTKGVTFKGLTDAQMDKVKHGHLHYPHPLLAQRCKPFCEKDFYLKPKEIAKLAGIKITDLKGTSDKDKKRRGPCMHKAFNGICNSELCKFIHEDWTKEEAKATLTLAEPGLRKLEEQLN